MWAVCSTITSPPRQSWAISAARLAMVPDGTNSASSLPVITQARRSSSATVGSSPRAASPSRAAAIAAIIAGVGRVTVSLRKSCMRTTRLAVG